jgi:hypothetical protein
MNRTTKNATTTSEAEATKAAEVLVGQIAGIQAKIANILAEAGQKIEALAQSDAVLENALLAVIKNQPATVAAAIAAAMKNTQVNTGDLSSNLVDAIEHKTHQSIYPTPWNAIQAKWCLVTR